MQKNVDLIKEHFPNVKTTVQDDSVKFGMSDLSKEDVRRLNAIGYTANDLQIKRSGKGITVIFKF